MSVYDEATPYAEAIGAPLFNGDGWANTSLIQSEPLLKTPGKIFPAKTWKLIMKGYFGKPLQNPHKKLLYTALSYNDHILDHIMFDKY